VNYILIALGSLVWWFGWCLIAIACSQGPLIPEIDMFYTAHAPATYGLAIVVIGFGTFGWMIRTIRYRIREYWRHRP
jgi:hypothetical protein